MQENITFTSTTNHKLSAIQSWLTSTDKIVILCHGLNSNKESHTNLELEKIFLKEVIAVFRFDFLAHGESEGEMDERSVNEFVENVRSAIKYVKERGYSQIGICGASFGGLASVIAASKESDVKVLALKAAGMGQTSRNMRQYKHDFDIKSWITAGDKIHIPTLIIHGTLDEDVEVDLGIQLAKSIKNSELRLYQGADHRFSKPEDFDRMIRETSEFVIRHLSIK